jgi:tight adherence protein C
MDTLIPLILFAALMAGISYYGYRYYAKPRRVYDQLSHPATWEDYESVAAAAALPKARMLAQAMRRIGERVPVSPQASAQVRRLLIAAGYRSESAVRVFLGTKVALGVVLFLTALVLRAHLPGQGSKQILLVALGGLAGYSLPGIILQKMVKRRQKRLRLSLPDALDLMVVCVEAGLGLDQAVSSVSRELRLAHRAICDELQFVNLEMRAGTRRMDAMRNLGERTGVPEIRKLVGVLIQADRFGTNISEALRTHSDYLRVQRRQQAEEKANKVAVKLVFPIFFCILPAIVLVAVGPAALQIFKVLLPTMRSMG